MAERLVARIRSLRRWARGSWGVPAASAALIALALALRSWHDLRIPRVGIEALVTIAVLGAFAIGELWEGAAVTFLFALGGALERATVGRTRHALARLFELAPETATVRRDGNEVVV